MNRFDYTAGPYSKAVWDSVSETVHEITQLDFLQQLAAGSLAPQSFVNYLEQDEIYLDYFGRSMATLAARAGNHSDASFWLQAAGDTIRVEQEMHASLMSATDLAAYRTPGATPVASPTTLGYSSFVLQQCTTASYEVGVAAVLPCFWVYAHVGKILVQQAQGLDSNSYRAWIETYDSPEFDESVRSAVTVYERLAQTATAAQRELMEQAFAYATRYELLFWLRAGQLEDWTGGV